MPPKYDFRQLKARLLGGMCLLYLACVAVAGVAWGCGAKTPQGKLSQAEALYVSTAGELSDLREAGRISAQTYHSDVAPYLRSAWAGIKRARIEVQVGNTDEVDVLLKSVNDALLRLQPLRPSSATTVPTTRPTIGAAELPPPAEAVVLDPVVIGLILGGATRLIEAGGKYLRGDTLSDEERAMLEQAADAEAARVDRLDPPDPPPTRTTY